MPPPDESGLDAPPAAARALGERCDWQAAYDLLCTADAQGELDAEGLELLGECARWVGRTERVVELFERAHHAYSNDERGAVRTALSLCYTHMDACEPSPAASWWQRADELIASLPEGPEHGLHAWFAGRARGDAGDIDGQEQHAQRVGFGEHPRILAAGECPQFGAIGRGPISGQHGLLRCLA